MKETVQMTKLDKMLRSSRLVAGGFMGSDDRNSREIIDADLARVEQLGYTVERIAYRMSRLTNAAKPRLGNWVTIDDRIRVKCEDYKGPIVCPWPHAGTIEKRVTTVECIDSGGSIRWTDLNIHMILQHGFFEGVGSIFRVDPEELIGIIF